MATGRLAEVEQDAMRITAKRFRDYEEEQQFKASKTQMTVEEAVAPKKAVVEPVEVKDEKRVK